MSPDPTSSRDRLVATHSRTALAGAILATTVTVHAQDITFVPRVEVGITQYTNEFFDAPAAPGLDIDTTFQVIAPGLRLGGTMIFDRLYIDSYYNLTAEAKDEVTYAEIGVSEEYSGDRTEFNATVGYNLGAGFTGFLGWRQSEIDGRGAAQNSRLNFEHDGFFVGGAYGIPIGERGSLSLSTAYARLDADLNLLFLGIQDIRNNGDGDGFKLGATYRSVLTEEWSATFSVDYFRYRYDMTDPLGEYTVEERDIQMRVGLSRRF